MLKFILITLTCYSWTCTFILESAVNHEISNTEIVLEENFSFDQSQAVLGNVKASVVVKNHSIFLLDENQSKIHEYDFNGRLIKSFGGEGNGPGEFESAQSMTFDESENQLLVLDFRNSRIVAFDVNSGNHAGTILLKDTFVTMLNEIFTFQDKIVLLGVHEDSDDFIHIITLDGLTEKSFGSFIDFKNMVYTPMGKTQLGQLHASRLDNWFMVILAAPNRAMIYDQNFEPISSFEDNSMPTPWETHMTMRSDEYRVEFYDMSSNNLMLNREDYLLHWVDINVDDENSEISTTHCVDLRKIHTAELENRKCLDDQLSIIGMSRVSSNEALLIVRDELFDYKMLDLKINE
jgi:hypothetical protein